MLDVESKRVEGHVDRVKADIERPRQIEGGDFAKQVRKIMGTTKQRVWDEVSDMLKDVSRLDGLPSSEHADRWKRAGTYEVKMDVERNEKLLERKGKKAEHGYEIADGIRSLLDDSRKLKHV